MKKKNISRSKAKRAMALLARVMELNANAKPDIAYILEFNGTTNGIYFNKMRNTDNHFEPLIHIYAYLDNNDLGYPINAIEAVIADEEKSQQEEQK